MAQTDIIARLQLRAEQFTSETGKAFADMQTKAATTAQGIKQTFNSSFAEVTSLAERALKVAPTAGGTLNLAPEIAQLNEAALAADHRAVAMRELAVAADRAATAEGVDTQAMRLNADAASVSALQAEHAAKGYRDQVVALEALQRELNEGATGAIKLKGANDNMAASSGRNRAGLQQLGFQIQDTAVQIAGGTSAVQALGQQLPQAIGALSLLGAEGSKMAAFFGGPWGVALGIGAAVLLPLVGNLLDSDDASKKAEESLKKFGDRQSDIGNFIDGTTGRLKEQNATLVLNAKLTRQSQIAANDKLVSEARQKSVDAALNTSSRTTVSRNPLDVLTGRAVQQGFDPAVVQAVRAANGDVGKLSVALSRLASTSRPDLLKTATAVSNIGGAAILASRDNERLRTEMAALNGDATALVKTTTAGIERRVADATAIGTVARAQARLNDVRARAAEIDKMDEGSAKNAAIRSYERDLTSATRAVQSAQAADKNAAEAKRDGAKATRDAAKENRDATTALKDQVAALDALTNKYDPLTAVMRNYADAVSKIETARQLGAGQPGGIDDDTAERYRLAARKEAIDAEISLQAEQERKFVATLSPAMQDAFVTPIGKLRDAGDYIGDAIKDGGKQVANDIGESLAGALQTLGSQLESLFPGGIGRLGAITSNISKIIDLDGKSGEQRLDELTRSIKSISEGVGISPKGAQLIGNIGGKAITGAAESALASSVFAPIAKGLGIKTSQTGSAIGGALGQLSGIPGGAIIGSIAGSIFGGLFKSAKYGGSAITYDATTRSLVSGQSFGNSSSAQAAAGTAADSVIQGLNSIAKTLGATISGDPGIVIGTYNGSYRVQTDGSHHLGGANHGAADAVDFGKDGGDAAVSYAIRQAIEKSVITGISQASVNILKSGQDLSAAIEKASLIENVPKDLKAMLDPVGAAIDALNRKFQETVDALKEGGATAEQMAQAQQLYNLQLDQVKAGTAAADAALKDFLTTLKIGSNSPLSLRDQEAAAKATLQPFLDAIAGGTAIDQGKYQDAAQGFLDIERKLYGSTDAYFAAFDQIQQATTKAIETIDNAVPISAGVANPFAEATASSTASTAANTQTGNEIMAQVNTTLGDVRSLLQQIAAGGGGSSSFANGLDPRLFARLA